jgi:hypothetical protein
MTQPRAQDELTWAGADEDATVTPPAPANQWIPEDGGIEPAPPPPGAPARVLHRFAAAVRRRLHR